MNVDIYAETYMEPSRHVYKQSGCAGFPQREGGKQGEDPVIKPLGEGDGILFVACTCLGCT